MKKKFAVRGQRLLKAILIGLGANLLSTAIYAQAYGQGAYNAVTYSNGQIQIGPITLPVTGPQLIGIISAALVATGVGLFVWLRQRKRQTSDL